MDFKNKTCVSVALTAVSIFACSQALAEDKGFQPDRIYIPVASYHTNNLEPENYGLDEWNEINPGVVVTWEDRFATLDYSIGGFRNSFDKNSIILNLAKTWEVASDTKMGIFVSLADYKEDSEFFDYTVGNTDYVFIAGAQISYKNVFFQVQPAPLEDELAAVFATGLTFSF